MWEPFRQSIEQWAPQCKIVYDKFHILQHANDAIHEVRKAEFYRQGPKKRGLIKGKKWLLQSRWKNLTPASRGELNRLFQLNRRVFKAYMLKESLERLWDYRYPGATINYLQRWMDQLKWSHGTIPIRSVDFGPLRKCRYAIIAAIAAARLCILRSRRHAAAIGALDSNHRRLVP